MKGFERDARTQRDVEEGGCAWRVHNGPFYLCKRWQPPEFWDPPENMA